MPPKKKTKLETQKSLYYNRKICHLRGSCKERGLAVSGNKSQIVKRLIRHDEVKSKTSQRCLLKQDEAPQTARSEIQLLNVRVWII